MKLHGSLLSCSLMVVICAGAACDNELEPGESADDPETWSLRFGGDAMECPSALTTDRNGNLLVTGSFRTNVAIGTETDFGTGPLQVSGGFGQDAFLLSLTPEGRPLWAKSFGGDGEDHGMAVAVDPSGDIIVTGRALREVSGPGNVGDYGGGEMVLEDDSFFVAKFAPDGTHLWSTLVPGIGDSLAPTMLTAVDEEGSTFVVTYSEQFPDIESWPSDYRERFVLTKIDSSGAVVWRKIALLPDVHAMAVDMKAAPGGGVILAAVRWGDNEEGVRHSGIVAKHGSDGELVYLHDVTQVPGAMALLPDGDIVLHARDLPYTQQLLRMSPDGEVRWHQDLSAPFDSPLPSEGALDYLVTRICGAHYEVVTTPDGEIVARDPQAVVGFSGSGMPLWEFVAEPDEKYPDWLQVTSMHALDDGRVMVAGTFQGTIGLGGDSHRAMGEWDVFLAIPPQ